MAATGRQQGEPLFIAGARTGASTVTVGTWISEVLRGAGDQIFDEMKNPWSNEIAPDRSDEVVIELRKLGSFADHGNYSLEDDAGLLAFLVKVYSANQLYKQRQL